MAKRYPNADFPFDLDQVGIQKYEINRSVDSPYPKITIEGILMQFSPIDRQLSPNNIADARPLPRSSETYHCYLCNQYHYYRYNPHHSLGLYQTATTTTTNTNTLVKKEEPMEDLPTSAVALKNYKDLKAKKVALINKKDKTRETLKKLEKDYQSVICEEERARKILEQSLEAEANK